MTEEPSSASTQLSSSQWWRNHFWEIQPLRELIWLLAAILLLAVVYVLRSILVPVTIGLAIAWMSDPLFDAAGRRWNLSRTVVLTGLLLVTLTLILAAVMMLVPQAVAETRQLIEKSPHYIQAASSRLEQYAGKEWSERFRNLASPSSVSPDSWIRNGIRFFVGSLGVVGSAFGTASSLALSAILIPFFGCLFILKFKSMNQRISGMIPIRHRERTIRILRRMDSVAGSYLRGRIVVTALMMIMFSVAFLAAGVPYWFLLGCLTGLLSFIPYLPVIGFAGAVLLTWLEAMSGNTSASMSAVLIGPLIAYSSVQLLEGRVITPWIQSSSMQMSPETVFIVLLFGGALAGIPGLLLAVPVAGCLRVLVDEFVRAPPTDTQPAELTDILRARCRRKPAASGSH
ncbi:MAG: AI-2E family transporter [Planctomycetaceae bacterium]